MTKTKQYLLIALLFLFASAALAQKDPTLKPHQSRALFHDYVDKEQVKALKSDGKEDKEFTVSTNEDINIHVTSALIGKINQLQKNIEYDSSLAGQAKVLYIRGLERLLQDMNANWRSKKFAVVYLPEILEAYEKCMEADNKKTSIEGIVEKLNYEAAKPLIYCTAFDNNAGIKAAKYNLVRKYCSLYPDQVFSTLRNAVVQLPGLPFADSLIKAAGYRNPKQLYDYAAADNELSKIIRKMDDPLVKTVCKMATSNGNGQLYFPFLDNLVRGKMTLDEIDAVRNDSIRYYKLLVRTHLDYSERMLNKDTAFEFSTLNDMMGKKARDVFVNTINGLHDRDVVTRFRIIQSLNAQELYYLAVLSDGIIYTSSYTKGVFPLMMSRVNNNGDSLLRIVMFDKYRKFIKMAAGYNTLSTFLSSFPEPENAKLLMRAFVGRLEETAGLEDGVDVADSYASIAETIKPIANEMLANVRLNYKRNISVNNKKGIEIYHILEKLFLSADSTQNIDLTRELGIPPVYEVPYNSLLSENGRAIIQVFIYGDRDGIGVFPSLLKMFSTPDWSIDRSNPQWVTINSIKGKPVSIYLNRPLPEENDEDAKAQQALCTYLARNNYLPAVTINRGHSYNAPYTIKQMFPSSRIVFMGSCGGYNMIHDILEKATDAHIIGTKQIADAPVNNPFFKLLAETLRNGKSVEWIPFWKELDKMVTNKIFEDYVPPYKNLGAIFIKAYKMAMGETGTEAAAISGR